MARYKHPRKTWQYTEEFKVKAVQLSLLPENLVKEVAEQLRGEGQIPSCRSSEISPKRDAVLEHTVDQVDQLSHRRPHDRHLRFPRRRQAGFQVFHHRVVS